MNQSPSTSSTTQTAPSWQLPYQQNSTNQAQAQYDSVSSPTQLVAPFSTQQNQAISGITNLATNGTPGTSAAQNFVTNSLTGANADPASSAYDNFAVNGNGVTSAANSYAQNVLSGNPANNPYLNSEFQQGANQVQNQLESEFAGSGANVLSSLPVQSDQLNNLATQLYGGAYNTGVQQQESALNSYAAPQAASQISAQGNIYGTQANQQLASLGEAVPLEQQQYAGQQNLYNAGGAVQGLAQNYITAPQQFLQQYMNQTMQAPGSTTSTPNYTNTGASTLGGALLGGSVGNSLGGSTGSLLGALLGGAGGAFL